MAALAFAATPAVAQEVPGQIVARAVATACGEQPGDDLSREKLAEWLLLASGISPADHAPADLTNAETRKWALELVNDPEAVLGKSPYLIRKGDPALTRTYVVRVLALRSVLNADLGREGGPIDKMVVVSPARPQGAGNWAFASSEYSLKCAPAKPPSVPTFAKYNAVIVRKTVDELLALDDARAAAGSAQVSYQNDRVTDLTGETRRTRTLTIDAAVAVAAPGSDIDRSLMAYADYTRHRQRISTDPTPVGEDQDGRLDDVDVLELGIGGTSAIGDVARATGRLGYIIDSVTGARLLIGNAQLAWIPDDRRFFGLCKLSRFSELLPGIETRCFARAELDVRHVSRTGRASFTKADELIGTGATVGMDIRKSIAKNSTLPDGLVGRLSYTYIPLVSGRGPDIDRFEAGIAYRWWAGDVAFDLGFNYTDGTERKSLADEHKFGVVFGILY